MHFCVIVLVQHFALLISFHTHPFGLEIMRTFPFTNTSAVDDLMKKNRCQAVR